MATLSTETKCSICYEETDTFLCRGCSKYFCFDHLSDHRQFLNEQFGLIQNDYNQFRQTILDLKTNPQKHPLLEQIDQWEKYSILKIKLKANRCRQLLIKHSNEAICQLERKLNNINEQLSSNQKQKNFNEIYLNQMRKKLEELNEQLNQPGNISIEQRSNSFISDILIRCTSSSKFSSLQNRTLDCPLTERLNNISMFYS